MSSAIHAVGVLLAVAILAGVYFLPFLVACWRRHPRRWLVFVVNVFGASGVAWIAALVIALWKIPEDRGVGYAGAPHRPVPADWRVNQRRLGLDDPGHPAAEPQNEH